MSNIIERIALIIESKGLSVRAFELSIGASNGMIGRAISKKTDISAMWLSKIIETYPDVSSKYLLTGNGNIFNTKSIENATISNGGVNGGKIGDKRKVQKTPLNGEAAMYDLNKPTPSIASDLRDTYTTLESTDLAIPSQYGIPLIPFDTAAGYMSGDGVQVMEYECEHYIVPTFKGAEFLIRITGMSMYPKYASGDIVACARLPLDTFFQWNKVYVVDSQQGILIKRIKQGCDDAHISLVSENKEFEPFELHRNELNSIALVIGLIRLE